jgi:phosphoribosylformylglycinamidine synthase
MVTAVHDVSDGGAIVAIAEMALAGSIGADLVPAPLGALGHDGLRRRFAEDQGRYVVTTNDANKLQHAAHIARIPVTLLGYTGTDYLGWHAMRDASLADLRAAHEGFFPALMQGEL